MKARLNPKFDKTSVLLTNNDTVLQGHSNVHTFNYYQGMLSKKKKLNSGSSLRFVTQEDIQKTINLTKTKTSSCIDELSAKLVKFGRDTWMKGAVVAREIGCPLM